PGQPDLVLMQITLLGALEHFEALATLARARLQGDCPTQLEVELRSALIIAELELNDVAAAQAEVLRLGGVRDVPAEYVADAWARIAVTDEFLGHPEEAALAFERSLDLGPGGLGALREISAREPQRQGACDTLVVRARSRHPDHPDLAVQQLLMALL